MTLFIKGCFGKRKEMKMKKVLRVLLLLVLMVPVMVFADVAGPENKPFEVEVKKSDGIPYYDYYFLKKDESLGTIPKGVTFTVYYQTVYEGVSYVGGAIFTLGGALNIGDNLNVNNNHATGEVSQDGTPVQVDINAGIGGGLFVTAGADIEVPSM